MLLNNYSIVFMQFFYYFAKKCRKIYIDNNIKNML